MSRTRIVCFCSQVLPGTFWTRSERFIGASVPAVIGSVTVVWLRTDAVRHRRSRLTGSDVGMLSTVMIGCICMSRSIGEPIGPRWICMSVFFCLSICVCVCRSHANLCCVSYCASSEVSLHRKAEGGPFSYWDSVAHIHIPSIWQGSLQHLSGAVLPAQRALSRLTLHLTCCDRRPAGKLVLLSCWQALVC